MRVFLISVAVATLAGAASAGAQPSYDCGGRLTATERAICDDPGLSALDRDMAAKFYAIFDGLAGDRQARFREEQNRWRADRDACGAAVGCLRANYVYRIGQLDAAAAGGAPAPTRLADTTVLPDGTIEKRRPDGGKVVRRPDGSTEVYGADGRKIPQYTAQAQVPVAGLPPLPQPLKGWASGLQGSLLIILSNILTDEEYAAYLPTESGKGEYGLIDWRIRSITFLTQP